MTLKPGDLFLFKLHSPKDYVVGGGTYAEFKVLTAASAWQEFGIRNGTPSQTELQNRLAVMRSKMQMADDVKFGSIVLIHSSSRTPSGFQYTTPTNGSPSTVQGKTLDSISGGKELWDQV